MPSYSNWTLTEYSGKTTPVTIYNGDITAVSLPGFLTEFGQMRAAIEGITLGVVKSEKWTGDDTLLSNAKPGDPHAQRESKWLVHYRDTVTNKMYRLEIGTADVGSEATPRLLPNTDIADPTNAEVAAFITRFNSFARSPEGNAVVYDHMEIVGRNI